MATEAGSSALGSEHGALDVRIEDGLRQVLVEAGIRGASLVFGLTVARHGDESRPATRSACAARQLEAIEAGQPDVHDRDLRHERENFF